MVTKKDIKKMVQYGAATLIEDGEWFANHPSHYGVPSAWQERDGSRSCRVRGRWEVLRSPQQWNLPDGSVLDLAAEWLDEHYGKGKWAC